MSIKNLQWLTEAQTQSNLGCKRGKLWKLRKEGLIEYSKVGNQTFYYWPSIEKLLKANSTITNFKFYENVS
jgi:hypothetical protein